jgi:hypothetical protein
MQPATEAKPAACRLARKNRLAQVDPSNRSYAFYADLEAMLLVDPFENPFSTASTRWNELRHFKSLAA